MTEPSTEPTDPAKLPRFPRIGSDGREAERYPEPFPPEEPAPNNKTSKQQEQDKYGQH